MSTGLRPSAPLMTPARRDSRWRVACIWLAALTVIALTAGLTRWQWGRAQVKLAQMAHAQALENAPAWSNQDWPCRGAAAAGGGVGPGDPTPLTRFQPARLRGEWLSAQTVWLDNRAMAGSSGFIAVTPLRLSAPAACAGQVVLVERGWAPRDAARRERLPTLPAAAGEVTVQGHVEPQVSAAYALGDEPDPAQVSPTSPQIRQNANHAFWQRWLARASAGQGGSWQVSPGVLRQHNPDDSGLLRDWPMGWQGTSPDRHQAYAAQWAALCLLTVGLTVWFQVVRPRRLVQDVDAPHLHA